MADEAEKKTISQLDFGIRDAINSLDDVNKKLEEIAKKSETYASTIGDSIKKGLNTGNLIDTKTVQNNLNTTVEMNEKSLQKINEKKAIYDAQAAAKNKVTVQKEISDTNVIREKALANVKVLQEKETLEVVKGEQKRLTEELKSQNKREEINARQLQSTKTLYDKISNYANTVILARGFQELKRAASETIQEMVEVEYKMIEIDRVLNDTSLNIDNYRDKLIQLAYDYGNTFDNVADVTLRLAQAGFDAEESLALTENTLLALNTADLDATEATSNMIAVMSQFGKMTGTAAEQAKEYGDIIDKINKVADNFPTTSKDILEALQKTGSAFNLAGATIDETIATIVAAEKSVQRGGKAIGTALSNIIQQLKAESKLDLAEEMGLDFFTDTNKTEFKPIMEIFEEMSTRMETLKSEGKESSVEMQNLLEMFTVFRRNIGASLLGEMAGEESTYAQVLVMAQDSIGYSLEENAKHMETAKAAQAQFNAELLKLKTEVWDNGLESVYRDMLSMGTDLVSGITAIIDKFGAFPTAITTATLAMGLFNKKMNAQGLMKYKSQLGDISAAIKLYNSEVKTGKATQEQFNDLLGKDFSQGFKNYISSLKGGEASMSGYITKIITATAKQLALNVAIAAGEAAISFGLSMAIQAITTAITNWINATEIAGDKLEEMNNNLEGNVTSLNQYADNFEAIRTEMQNSNLTQEEFNVKKLELKKIEEELIKLYGDEAKGIDLVTGSIDRQKEAINDLAKQDFKKYEQENQKEIQKLAETFSSEFIKYTDFTGDIGKRFSDNFKEGLNKIVKDIGGTTDFYEQNILGNVYEQLYINLRGTPEQLLKNYRELYDKIDEYRKTLTGEDLEYANKVLADVSTSISQLEEQFGKELEAYKKYLEEKLQYDEDYSKVYGKILEARAELSKAMLSGNEDEIKEAQAKLANVYVDAIKQAQEDPDVSIGMVEMLKEQLDELEKTADKQRIKLKIGIDGDEVGKQYHKAIQNILDSLGDISVADLSELLGAEKLENNLLSLKGTLDMAGISVEDFIELFEDLGFTIGNVPEKTEIATVTIEDLNKSLKDNLDTLGNLADGYQILKTAQEEYNTTGAFTIDTLSKLVDNNLLQYLDIQNGQLQINTQSMVALGEATKIKAIQSLQDAAAADIEKLALGDVKNMSAIAQNAIAQFGNNSEVAGNQAATASSKIMDMAAALDTATKAAEGKLADGTSLEDFNKQANAIKNAYLGIARGISNIQITTPRTGTTTTGSTSGSSSTVTNAAEKAAEEAKKAAEEAYKARVDKYKTTISDMEDLEKRWVKKQDELGQLSNKDYIYITQERIKRYQSYLDQIKQMTWLSVEDRATLEKQYTEQLEDYQLEYFKYLKNILDEEIKALEDARDKEIEDLKEANTQKIQAIKDEAQAKIDALQKVEKENDRIRAKEEYLENRSKHLEDISYWEQRTGREAQEALKEAKKNLEELDKEWKQQQEDWDLEDQIQAIEDERDAQVAAIEEMQEAQIKAIEEATQKEIDALQAVYDARVKLYSESNQIIFEDARIASDTLYQTYKENFVDKLTVDLKKLTADLNADAKKSTTTTSSSSSSSTKQEYTNYKIKAGDTLSAIAAKYGTTVSKIMAANPSITDKNMIYTGNTLKIPKFHEGGIVGGNQEAFALLKPNEVILKPEWAEGINKLAKMAKQENTNITGPNTSIEVKGDLVRIEANIKNRTDADYLTKKVKKIIENEFNIKK